MRHTILLGSVAKNFDSLMRYSQENTRELGRGALVFFEDQLEGTGPHPGCEYWTMGKLRDCLRQLDEYDECVYRWLLEAEAHDALAVVVFSPGTRPGTMDMSFHTMTHHQAV